MLNCPSLWETNCKNRDLLCNKCLAGLGGTKLLYEPISKKVKQVHPCKNIQASNRGQESNKRGRKVEKDIVKDLGLIPTEASGAKFRDGDGKLELTSGDLITISIKSRTANNKLAITKDEYRRDEIHFIHSKEYGTVVIMSKLVFEQLEDGFIRQQQEEIKEL